VFYTVMRRLSRTKGQVTRASSDRAESVSEDRAAPWHRPSSLETEARP
jgi:hypothetical protein